ncbi:MAG: hypothetical protein ACPGVG_09765 [Mycobacterium sp.]
MRTHLLSHDFGGFTREGTFNGSLQRKHLFGRWHRLAVKDGMAAVLSQAELIAASVVRGGTQRRIPA